ncbi:MAG: hypothetical protein H7A33_07535 [Deltaproteobacteria bacterium]|nr:hypothetical protein [Deltaproteobacteria bacterium]
MSCKDEDKQKQLKEHIKHHLNRACPKCGQAMHCEDGALPFGEALMMNFVCACGEEDVVLVKPDGETFEVGN